MKKPQWIAVGVAVVLTTLLLKFGRTVPNTTLLATNPAEKVDSSNVTTGAFTTDSMLTIAKKQLTVEQLVRITSLENSVVRGDIKAQQISVYNQLSRFWGDSLGFFPPYAWYQAQAARLENSEKTLTFAAHLFLDNLEQEQEPALRQWEGLQAKDLFERSLTINPGNDSSKVGLGACYLFGNISDAPMQGIAMIREVASRDSNNVYAQITLAKGDMTSGQTDKVMGHLQTVLRLQPSNVEAILIMADVFEKKGDKAEAISWYRKSLDYVKLANARTEISKRIAELEK